MSNLQKTPSEEPEQLPFPQQGADVLCTTGSVSKIECVTGRGLFGWIVELSNGLFVEVKPNLEKESLQPWREV